MRRERRRWIFIAFWHSRCSVPAPSRARLCHEQHRIVCASSSSGLLFSLSAPSFPPVSGSSSRNLSQLCVPDSSVRLFAPFFIWGAATKKKRKTSAACQVALQSLPCRNASCQFIRNCHVPFLRSAFSCFLSQPSFAFAPSRRRRFYYSKPHFHCRDDSHRTSLPP